MKHPILKFTYYEKASQFLKTLAILLTLSNYLTSDSKKNVTIHSSDTVLWIVSFFESDVNRVGVFSEGHKSLKESSISF